MKASGKKIKPAVAGLAVILLAAGIVLICGTAIYGFGAGGRAIEKVSAIIPFPAATIGSDSIAISALEKNLKAVKMFYENQDFSATGMRVDFSTEDGRKRLLVKKKNLLNKMIDNAVVEKLAVKRGIELSAEMVAQEVSRKISETGTGESLAQNLQKLYGWDVAEFTEQIVKPDLYKEKLMQYVREADAGNAAAKAKIEKAAEEIKNGKNFAEAAKAYSDGESAEKGGDLGWFSADQMLPQLAVAAFSLEKEGAISAIVESDLGFHILKLDGKKTEDGIAYVKVSQIIARTTDFSNWLIEQEKSIKIYVPLKEFRWNKEAGAVEFSDDSLRKFEEDLEKNSGGDISVLF